MSRNLPPGSDSSGLDAEQEAYEERAAILEYLAGYPREEAERRAREIIRREGGR